MLLFLTLFFFTNLNAQSLSLENPGTPEQRADSLTQRMTIALELSEEQIPNIHTVNLKYTQKAQVEIIDKELSMWSMYMKGSKLNKQKEKELKPLLTDKQWKLYKTFKAENRSRVMKQAGFKKY